MTNKMNKYCNKNICSKLTKKDACSKFKYQKSAIEES